ncbi:MAG TPA: PAS domain S-box protein [Anaerolineae bacterium]|nr:PAS domain S-box protein [Anaerolineae bacterium]
MVWLYTPYFWLFFTSAIITGALGVYAWQRRTVPGATSFALLMLISTWWAATNGLEVIAADLPTKLLWANLQYLAYVSAPVVWVVMTLQYTGRERWLTRGRLIGLSIIPLLTLLLVWTNDFHNLMRQGVRLDTSGPLPVIGKIYGPWHWVHIGYSYLLLSVAFVLLLGAMMDAPPPHRGQPLALLIGLLLTMLWNGAYALGFSLIPGMDTTAVSFIPMGVMVVWGLFRHRLFDVVPVARATVVENMGEGVIVIDAQGRIADLNPAARRMLGLSAPQAVGRETREVLSAWPALQALCEGARETEAIWETEKGQQRHYHLSLSPLSDHHGHPLGRLILLRDATEERRVQARRMEQQRTVAILSERERLARELHDSLGQVLGFISVQAQAVRILLSNGQAGAADARLARLVEVAHDAHADVRESILSLRAAAALEQGFFTALEGYIDRFSRQYGVSVELAVPDDLRRRSFGSAVEVQLLRIVQEAISNVRKHASTPSARIAFSERAGWLQVVIEDEGHGFDPQHRSPETGFGLRIMRERAEEVGGSVEVKSTPGRETRITVRMPLGKATPERGAPAMEPPYPTSEDDR